MSQYEYYEFQTVDRRLTAAQMDELRSYSSRARITPTSFSVDYSWGSFKGDADTWLEKTFDAFVYLANWGTRILKIGLPARLLDLETAEAYCRYDIASVRQAAGKVIVSFVSDDDERGDWLECDDELSELIPLRAELAQGDLRALYLGWLLGVQQGDIGDESEEDEEPPVPPGLRQLSPALEALAAFLGINEDLLHVAAEASPPLAKPTTDRSDVGAWIRALPSREKDDILTDLVLNADGAQVAELRQRYRKAHSTGFAPAIGGRTVGDLLKAAETHAEERARIAAEERAREKARRAREAKAAREKHLDGLVGSEGKLWAQVDSLIATKQPKSYDQAVKLLVDLRDLAARSGGGDFELRLADLRMTHTRKPSFLERLQKVGL